MKKIVIRVDRCMGCKSCELACAVAHSATKNLMLTVLSGKKPGYRVNVEAAGRYSVPLHCNHCEDAPCIMACPTGALNRKDDDEPVVFDAEKCIGCTMCVEACPVGVLTVNVEGKGVLKCDLCIERLEQGLEPACVAACPTAALVFETPEKAPQRKRKKAAAKLAAGVEAK